MTISRPRPITALCAAILLAAGTIGALAQSPDDCEAAIYENDERDLLCATAIDFGAFAAFLRDGLSPRSGPAPAPVARKLGDDPWRGLSVANAQRTSGSFSGYATNLLLGADTTLSPSLSGGLAVYAGRGAITPPSGTRIDREEVLVGPYFSAMLSDRDSLSGFLLYGRPEYRVNNVPSTGETLVGSLIWSRAIQRQGIDFTPMIALSVKRERPTATDRIDATILTIGSSIDGNIVATGAGYRQFFGRVEFDIGNYNDTFTNDVSYVAPRVGVGARFLFGNGAALQAQVNYSAASDRTSVATAQLNYRFEF